MSRIGNQVIVIPASVQITITEHQVLVTGPKGKLEVTIPRGITLTQTEDKIKVARKTDSISHRALHGLVRSLIFNAVKGVETGYERKLILQGVGYRAIQEGPGLTLSLGFSHTIKVAPPEGIQFKVEKNTITISGIDKQAVGQTAADIRKLRKPEPYKGKGIRYSDEIVRRKPGKTAKGATAV